MNHRDVIALAAAAALAALPALALAQKEHLMLVPQDIQSADLPEIPGVKVTVLHGDPGKAGPFVVRVRYPANGRVPPHTHPVTEHLTVISGTFHVGMGEKFDRSKTRPLPAGSFAIAPADSSPHFAWTSEETVLQVHGTGPWGINYVDPNDAPKKP